MASMEYLLGGTTARASELVRYLLLQDNTYCTESVSETVYKYGQLVVVVASKQVVQYHPLAERAGLFLKVVYPPDRSKCRKALCRRVEATEALDDRRTVETCLELLGCTDRKTRRYTQSVYSYQRSEITIISGEASAVVLVKLAEQLVSEDARGLEELKQKLAIWVQLDMPPERIWPYLN